MYGLTGETVLFSFNIVRSEAGQKFVNFLFQDICVLLPARIQLKIFFFHARNGFLFDFLDISDYVYHIGAILRNNLCIVVTTTKFFAM